MEQPILVESIWQVIKRIGADRPPFDKPWVLISITTDRNRYGSPWSSPFVDNNFRGRLELMGCVDVHQAVFADALEDTHMYRGMDKINPDDATEIRDFLHKYCPAHSLLVHCDAGISRSGAVGLYAARYLFGNEEEYLEVHPKINPNSFVLKLLEETV